MLRRFQLVLLRSALGVVACATCFPSASSAAPPPRRERILISEVPGGLAIPGLSRQKTTLDDSLDFLDKRSSVSGVVAPYASSSGAAVPNAKAAAKMMEKLEQKKNWMFQNQLQEESGAGKNDAEEALQVGDYDLAGGSKRKGSVQRYMERDPSGAAGGTNSQARASEDSSSDANLSEADRRYNSPLDRERNSRSVKETSRDGGPGRTMDRERTGNLAGRSAFEAMRPAGEDSRFQGGAFNRFSGGNLPDRSIAARDAEFRKMLEPIGASSSAAPGASANPLGGLFDPVNLSPDLTRQEINPVTPNLVPDVGRLSQPNILGSVRGLNTAFSGPRPGGFLDGVGRPAAGPGSAPAIIDIPKPVIMTPQPGVLDIPRRPH